MTFAEWEEKYKPISIVENELFSQDYAELKDPRCADNCSNLWTVVEVDNGDWIISNGFHLVNRVGYILTEVPWEEEFLEVTYLTGYILTEAPWEEEFLEVTYLTESECGEHPREEEP
jgi:hypothetical protein